MIAHRVFCVSVICSAVIITPANAGPMNFLRVIKGDKKTNHSGTTRLRSATTGLMFVASSVVLPSGDIGAHVAMDVAPKQPPPIDGIDLVGGYDNRIDRVSNENKKNKCDTNNNAMFQRLCSAVLYAATMPQLRSKFTDVTAGSPPSSQSLSNAATVVDSTTPAERRHHRMHKSFRKRFPPAGYGSGPHEWFGATMRPADRYRDPILAQETSRGVDYLTSYPLAKGGVEDEEKYYEDAERPAEVWKIKVVGELMAKSSKSSAVAAAAADDDDDDDDEVTAADESR